jgi:hypothetical protein
MHHKMNALFVTKVIKKINPLRQRLALVEKKGSSNVTIPVELMPEGVEPPAQVLCYC